MVVTVSGPPGSGMTRLAAELAVEVDAAGAGVGYQGSRAGEPTVVEERPALVVLDDLPLAAVPRERV